MTSRNLALSPEFHRFVGLDSIFAALSSQNHNYPPYNIVKHSEDEYVIELAVAGFSEDELGVTVEKNTLTVSGSRRRPENEDGPVEYMWHGLANRDFEQPFNLTNHLKVHGATVKNGILYITLHREVPESEKPQKIAISSN